MPVGNFVNRVSEQDKHKVYEQLNPSKYEEGFSPDEISSDSGSNDGQDDFSSLDNISSGSNEITLGGFSTVMNGDENFNGSTEFNVGDGSNSGNEFNAFGVNTGFNSFDGINNQQKEVVQKPDAFDKLVDASAAGIVVSFKILTDMVKSIRTRSQDDWALVGARLIKVGLGEMGFSIILALIGLAVNIKALMFSGMPVTLFISGGLLLSNGLICLGTATGLKLSSGNISENAEDNDIKSIPDTYSSDGDMQDLAKDLNIAIDNFDDEDSDDVSVDEGLNDLVSSILSGDSGDEILDKMSQQAEKNKVIQSKDPEEVLSNISEQPMLNRKLLFDTLAPLFPTNEPEFNKHREITSDNPETSDLYYSIASTLQEALAQANDIDKSDVKLEIVSITDTLFSYILVFKRDRSFTKKNNDILEAEIVNFFKEDADDDTVSAELSIVGNTYTCLLSKGEKLTVTLGDCLTDSKVRDYFTNTSNLLPFVIGIDINGKVILGDSKDYPSMMYVGVARSGKSWSVLNWLISLASFNSPEDIQFLVIDPKESQLFKAVGLLPHCCGVSSQDNVMQILKDILDIEAKRRKRLLDEYKCDKIWDLREKGIQLPFLYIVIDEVMTVIKSLEMTGNNKDFLNLVIQIITQLPSLGIGILMVPHRAQSVVDKTTRTQIQFRAAIRAPQEVIKETLDINKWNRALTLPGDTVYMTTGMGYPQYVKGVGVTLSDNSNIDLLHNIARAFYKMGCTIPDMSTIGAGYSRDIAYIKRELKIERTNDRVQFDSSAYKINDSKDNSDALHGVNASNWEAF